MLQRQGPRTRPRARRPRDRPSLGGVEESAQEGRPRREGPMGFEDSFASPITLDSFPSSNLPVPNPIARSSGVRGLRALFALATGLLSGLGCGRAPLPRAALARARPTVVVTVVIDQFAAWEAAERLGA